jgi:hypothetical protein
MFTKSVRGFARQKALIRYAAPSSFLKDGGRLQRG